MHTYSVNEDSEEEQIEELLWLRAELGLALSQVTSEEDCWRIKELLRSINTCLEGKAGNA